jgi:hypothetical protein
LTTGILEAVMISHDRDGARVETPHLEFGYQPTASILRRPSAARPHSATLTGLPMPEPGSTTSAKILPVGRDGTQYGQRG